MFLSKDVETRQYAYSLFASVCVHSETSDLYNSLLRAEAEVEIRRLLLSLGQSLSLSSVRFLLEYRVQIDDEAFDQYISDALATLLGIDLSDQISDVGETRQQCEALMVGMDYSVYYFEGKPAFVGDVSKELVTYAVVARREEQPFALSYEPH